MLTHCTRPLESFDTLPVQQQQPWLFEWTPTLVAQQINPNSAPYLALEACVLRGANCTVHVHQLLRDMYVRQQLLRELEDVQAQIAFADEMVRLDSILTRIDNKLQLY